MAPNPSFFIRRTEVVGPPHEDGCIRMQLGDSTDQGEQAEWSLLQVVSDTREMNQLAAIQLRALQRLRTLIAAEISGLESRLNADALRPD